MSKSPHKYDDEEIFGWYRQFSHENVDLRFFPDRNAFCRVSKDEIRKLEAQTKVVLPTIYQRFLLEIGEGRLKQDRTGRIQDGNTNYFMGPESIAELLSKTTGEWNIYPNFFSEDEIPFFDLGSATVFVFAPNDKTDSTVWFPNRFERIANSFVEFLGLLRDDIEFYNSSGRSLNN